MDITLKSGIEEFGFLLQDGDTWLSSQRIGDVFDKKHFHVLEKIKGILSTPDNFTDTNFRLSEYKDSSGKNNKEYLLNRKSFALVAMGFTGDKALKFKKDYIDAFEYMRELIITRELAKDEYKMMTDAISKYMENVNTYTYANEADMINKVVLGMTAKQFKELHNLNKNDANRDHYALNQLSIWRACQKLNATLIVSKLPYQQRKDIIVSYCDTLEDTIHKKGIAMDLKLLN